MSVVSIQLNQACHANPDLFICGPLQDAGIVVIAIFVLALPFMLGSVIKDERFKKSDWTVKLAIGSGVLMFIIFAFESLVGYLTRSLDREASGNMWYPLIGMLPYVVLHFKDILKVYEDYEKKDRGG